MLISVASASSVAKIIKTDIILKNNIFFPEHMKYEDIATTPLLWIYAENIYKVKEPLYIYRRRENSITLSENSIGHYDIFAKNLFKGEYSDKIVMKFVPCMCLEY